MLQATASAAARSYPEMCDVADLLRQIPDLRELLSPKGRSALLACSRQLRQVIHSTTTAVTVKRFNQIEAVLEGSWPQLALIKTEPTHLCCSFHEPDFKPPTLPTSNFHILASLDMGRCERECVRRCTCQPKSTCAALFVSPKSQQPDPYRSFAAACSYLPGPEWQYEHWQYLRLQLGIDASAPITTQIVALVAERHWPWVTELTLSNCQLSHDAMADLICGNWSRLRWLDLGSNQLDEDAVARLLCGDWQQLEGLVLEANPRVHTGDLAPIAHCAPELWWRLEYLSLARITIDSVAARHLSQMRFLASLDLSATSLDAAAISQLFLAPWPNLQKLALSHNSLTTDAVALLVSSSLPELRCLQLDHNKLDTAAAQHIARGVWPLLHHLDLAHNQLDDTAMAVLAHGRWPVLRKLSLKSTLASAKGIERLAARIWPKTRRLNLAAIGWGLV